MTEMNWDRMSIERQAIQHAQCLLALTILFRCLHFSPKLVCITMLYDGDSRQISHNLRLTTLSLLVLYPDINSLVTEIYIHM